MHSARRNVGRFIRLDLQDSMCFINEATGKEGKGGDLNQDGEL